MWFSWSVTGLKKRLFSCMCKASGSLNSDQESHSSASERETENTPEQTNLLVFAVSF